MPLSLKVMPLGNVPNSIRLGTGSPVVVTAKLPAAFWLNVVLAAEVKTGAASTVREKVWDAFGLTPLAPCMVRLYTP